MKINASDLLSEKFMILLRPNKTIPELIPTRALDSKIYKNEHEDYLLCFVEEKDKTPGKLIKKIYQYQIGERSLNKVPSYMKKILEEDGFVHERLIDPRNEYKYLLECLYRTRTIEAKYYRIPRTNDVLRFMAYKISQDIHGWS